MTVILRSANHNLRVICVDYGVHSTQHFDRILLNGLIQPFQQEQRVAGFFDTYRQLYPVSREHPFWMRLKVGVMT